jgi:DHA1 family bicyclomycin/chloramphenicol resistance-like MFS transporter
MVFAFHAALWHSAASMQTAHFPEQRRLIIGILGALSTISPFSIDMYLAAFPQVAADLHTSESQVALTVSSYFDGLAFGQLFYGPLLDRFGRRVPLYCGLSIFVAASLACASVESIHWFIVLRFLQALGGCVAQVASNAMVRDFFPISESANMFSRLLLIIGVSPLLAPTVGAGISSTIGWRWIFVILALVAMMTMAVTAFWLPQGYTPDTSVSLHPKEIVSRYRSVLSVRQFRVYVLAASFVFATLFVYVAGSPLLFLKQFAVSTGEYSLIFAVLTGGFIGSSQVNIWLHSKCKSEEIFYFGTLVAFVIAIALFLSGLLALDTLPVVLSLLFLLLFSIGLTFPNGSALALAPFTENIGSAAAMLGFLQMGIGAAVSSAVGLSGIEGGASIFAIFVATIGVGAAILINGRRRLPAEILADSAASVPVH